MPVFPLALGAIIAVSAVSCVEPPDRRSTPVLQDAAGPAPAEAEATAASGTAPGDRGQPAPAAPSAGAGEPRRIVHEGIAVELSVTPVDTPRRGDSTEEIVQGENVRVQFRITDTATGAPATTLEPAAWIHPTQPEIDCKEKIGSFLSGSLGARAEVDLNVYYVLALNEDASISIVDPLFGYGGSKLLAMASLKSPGEDWVLGPDSTRLFVTMPLANKVAVIDTGNWKVLADIDAAQRPSRIAIQPDGKYLWVGSDGVSPLDITSGVTVIDAAKLERLTTIPTGSGHHEIAFSDDSHHAWVTNGEAGTVSILDIRNLRKVKDIETGARPVSVAFSPLSNAAYVVSADEGLITVIDGSSLEVTGRLRVEPGLGALRFAPGGRLGFVVHPSMNAVHILDAATGRIVQTADVGESPDQVAFTENLAYVRSLGSEIVLMIPLGEVGKEGAPVPVVDFPAGQAPLGQGNGPSIAQGIVPAPGGTSVLVANPADGAIYYYREGMAAPMGNFQNYGRRPRAVLVVDRSLNEVEPGVYATNVRLDLQGKLDVTFFLNSPRISHCFSIDVAADPNRLAVDRGPRIKVDPILDGVTFRAGEVTRLQLMVTDPKTEQAREGIKDLGVLTAGSGNWQERRMARPVGSGLYEVEFSPPWPGAYFVSFQCPSLNVRLNEMPPLMVRVAGGEPRHE